MGLPASPSRPPASHRRVRRRQDWSGNSNGNSFSGSYTAGGADLKIADMISTMMACADQALMQQESDYVNALGAARSFALAGDQLTISYDGGELRFTRQAPVADRPLEGRWQLTTFVAGEFR